PGARRLAAGAGAARQRACPAPARKASVVSPSPVYVLEDVRQAYAGRIVLHVERLHVEAGEVLGLVGPTGAGKSTLLRLLAGLEPPVSGRASFFGHPLSRLSQEMRRRVTLVFQRPLLLGGSVRANVAYGLRLRGSRRPDGRVEAALKQLGL